MPEEKSWEEQWHGPHGPHESWGAWAHGQGFDRHDQMWQSKRRFFFRRFVRFGGLLFLLVFGGMAVMSAIVTHLIGGDQHTALIVWLAGSGFAFGLPLLAVLFGMRAYRGFTTPLINVMAAADAVAGGDLGVRVPENTPGEFGRLARSFNRMTAELARSDQQRRNLTADVAHELRTPLHIIQGNLEGILDGVYAPTPEHIQATLDETRALARLVEDLRTLSLAEGGQLPLTPGPVDVAELVADIATSFGPQAEAAGITLAVETRGERQALTIEGDAGRLDQVLSNLVVNALRHTPSGGSITLHAAATATGVIITVTDTGEGIPAADLPYIFDRFWRGDRSRTHTGGAGAGLGLAIARQLVQAHGGQIEVTSELGQGTTFRMELPAQRHWPGGR